VISEFPANYLKILSLAVVLTNFQSKALLPISTFYFITYFKKISATSSLFIVIMPKAFWTCHYILVKFILSWGTSKWSYNQPAYIYLLFKICLQFNSESNLVEGILWSHLVYIRSSILTLDYIGSWATSKNSFISHIL